MEEEPSILWAALQTRYEQQKAVILSKANHDWTMLRLQDFKFIGEYNHVVHKICARLCFCEKEPSKADKIEKTLQTMLPSDRILQHQYRTKNLPDAFTDYKCVTKSWNPVVNAPKRVEVAKKITPTPSIVKRGRVTATKKDNTLNKYPRKEKMMHLQKTVNVSRQPVVDRHLVDIPQSSTQARYRNENASTSENPDDLVLGNHETSMGIQEISINYTSSKEVYDHSTIIVWS
jgi:very-short-patch-repair endonuclease